MTILPFTPVEILIATMNFRLISSLLIVVAFMTGCTKSKMNRDFKLETGDILFQDIDCGSLCDAIETVTQGYNGARLSHLGLIAIKADSVFVFEAIGEGVVETPLQEFLHRSKDDYGNPKVIVARIKEEYKSVIPKLLLEKEKYLGLPYNHTYTWNDSSYYCSQLLHVIFKNANNGKDFFELTPMTFKEPNSDTYFKTWIDYYNKLGIDIPEGEPGINPGGMSRSDKIKVVHIYGNPEKMVELQ